MNNKWKIQLTSIFLFISVIVNAKQIDSLILFNRLDSLESNIKYQKAITDTLKGRIEMIEKEISQSDFFKPIEIDLNKSALEIISEIFIIVISILTLFYVVKSDRINELYGSYIGKKKYFNLQQQIAELSIKLKNVKNEFEDFINIEPNDFIINSTRDLTRLKKLTDKIEKSQYFTYPGDIHNDRQELIYETRPHDKIVYCFNKYVESRISHCRQIISDIETDILKKINEAENIKTGS